MLRTLIGPDNGDATVGQLCVRALILFVVGIVYIRIAGRRTFSQSSPLDIVAALVVGSNLSRAMIGKAPFWPALAATLLLVVLHRMFAMLTIRWRWLAKLMKAEPVVLVREGQPDRRAMLWHGIGEADLPGRPAARTGRGTRVRPSGEPREQRPHQRRAQGQRKPRP